MFMILTFEFPSKTAKLKSCNYLTSCYIFNIFYTPLYTTVHGVLGMFNYDIPSPFVAVFPTAVSVTTKFCITTISALRPTIQPPPVIEPRNYFLYCQTNVALCLKRWLCVFTNECSYYERIVSGKFGLTFMPGTCFHQKRASNTRSELYSSGERLDIKETEN